MNKIYIFFLLLFSICTSAQIKGKVTDKEGKPIAFASVSIEKIYLGTSTNENGLFELNYTKEKQVVLVVKTLGYKTKREQVVLPIATLTIVLEEENNVIEEVIVQNKENPANAIIKNAIAARKSNTYKTDKFEANFYSRGLFRVKNMPKKILGIEVGDLEGNLDSTGTGIIYQSETVSKISFEKPNNLKEEIIASKVAGDNNGFSFNTALDTDYDFYQNTISFNVPMISPIASNAFAYYKFKLVDTFYDAYGNFVTKIQVTPKRDKEPVFEGFIYVVEDSWALYAIDLDIKGYRSQNEFLETLKLVQNYNFNPETKLWVKNLQSFDFQAGFFGIKFNGKFTHVFSDYVFKETFDKKTFSREVVTIVANANKKEATFWDSNRPVPLTEEESSNYIKKDSVFKVRSSKVYLDSIDAKTNKFKLLKLITGYTYKNSFKKSSFTYQGLFNLASLNFNTVQGYHISSGFYFSKYNEEKQKKTRIGTDFEYGFSDLRLRPTVSFYHKFNNTNDLYIRLAGGNKVSQFNREEPIGGMVNTVSTLFFKNNFMKVYEKEFAEISAGKEVVNGVFLNAKFAYENRKPLFNTTDYTLIKSSDAYSSNNPLLPNFEDVAAITTHHLLKFNLGARFVFGQKYITRPDGKLNINDGKFPVLQVNYEKGFSGSSKNYAFDYVEAKVSYTTNLSNKGEIISSIKGGKFFNASVISFVDYKHFNGNQTHVKLDGSLSSFNLLPYYSHSTNNQFVETHVLYNDNGFISNKIPLINKLAVNIVGGFHQLNLSNSKPYQEVSVGLDRLGFGKFKLFRVEYVRSYQGGFRGDGVLFGLRF